MTSLIDSKAPGPRALPDDVISFDFSGISKLEIPELPISQLKVDINNVSYELLLNKKVNAKNLLVFGQSALSSRTVFPLPIYHRWTWFDDFPEAHCIALNDPTLYLDDAMLGGWFQGTRNNFYIEDAVALIRNISQKLGVATSNIFFYGSSAGGFTSLLMAGLLEGATAIAEIPQTDMRKYHVKSALDAILLNCYNGDSLDNISDVYASRLSVIEFYKKINRVPNIIYLQNCADSIHLHNHLIPFIEGLEEFLPKSKSRFQLEFYSARTEKGDGHVAAPRGWVGRIIREAFARFGNV